MESVIPLDSHNNSDSEQEWDAYSDECSESIPSTTLSEKCWSQKIHPRLPARMANTVYDACSRCLIDNTVNDSALTYLYCLSRRLEPRRVNALEFAWGMQRGTLNLNTRFNVLCAAMNNKDFPDVGDGTHNYRFIPHPDMKAVAIHRQIAFFDEESEEELKPEHFIFSSYPFENLGTLTCHLHPKFVICHIGWMAARAGNEVLSKYTTAHPSLLEPIIMCLQICNKWNRLLDKTNPKHLLFLKNKINPGDVITENCDRTGNERLRPHISQKNVKKHQTGVKRKRKSGPPHFVPTNRLRMLEEQISPAHAAQRKWEDILFWRSTISDEHGQSTIQLEN
ncbi:hypothetical protein Clacol_006057 [Clathrus columnatus]|uniref:Uncharacterized protein n=1 Tax=Clathrus columnatus TaxID=1419009 RepID=A0AAV5AB24_9AGAM|nr:hypothetical protein Clacol_006057 [Clathrus columnatus]